MDPISTASGARTGRALALLFCLGLVLAPAACRSDPAGPLARPAALPGPAPAAPDSSASTAAPVPAAAPAPSCGGPPWRLPAAARVVAIGDLHGDLAALRGALRLAGALDAADHWSGGDLVVVITGDLVDRGDHDLEALELVRRLEGEAPTAGGRLVFLLGNHELMNAYGDFRYVSEASARAFERFAPQPGGAAAPGGIAPALAGRAAAFAPGGPWALWLAEHNVATQVGDTVYVHGGLLPEHVRRGLDDLNCRVRRWLRAEGPLPKELVRDRDAPVWQRLYSLDASLADCQFLDLALAGLPAARMVVGHTPQLEGITAGCDERVWRIDTGLSGAYGGPLQVLEIVGDRPRALGGGGPALP